MSYKVVKGTGRQEKPEDKMFLTKDQVFRILAAIEKDQKNNPNWKRDHCAIYLGFFMGLRISEAAMLSRDTFRFIENGQVFVKTLKQAPKVKLKCDCGREWRVSSKKIGKTVRCKNCADHVAVKAPRDVDQNPPEKQLPAVERQVLQYVKDYLETLPDDQEYMFCPRGDHHRHIAARTLHSVFITYASKAGLDKRYSWHALRHGRGVAIWSLGKNLKLVQNMLRHKSMMTSERYVHLDPKEKGKMVDDLSEAYEE